MNNPGMYRWLLLFVPIFTFLSLQALTAQSVKVIDKNTLHPIENVYIFNNKRNKTISTNANGEAELSEFSAGDTLNFQHPAYKRLALTFSQIRNRGYKITLDDRPLMMDEIFVSASKRQQELTEIPQKIIQISQDEIQFNNPQTTADLLQSSGEIFVQKSQLGGGSPMIRGFAANSVLLTVDGIRMNNAIFRSGNLQNVISIDPNALENAEVLFGPGSIIYGSDALGGVMNFQTKEPALSLLENQTVTKINSLVRYSSANNERTIHADASLGNQKWGFLSSITYSDFNDLRSGGSFYDEFPNFGKRTEYVIRKNGTDVVVENDQVTLQRFSGYDQFNVMQKIRFRPSDSLNVSYGFHYATSTDIPRYDRLIQREEGDTGPFSNAEWYYGPQIWMMNNLRIDHSAKTTFFNSVSGVFSQQWFQESRNDRDFQGTQLRNREENVTVYTANIDFDKIWDKNKKLYYGLESIYNYVASQAYQKNIVTDEKRAVATRYPDEGSDYTQLAAYVKYQQDLSSILTAVTGLRYSHILLNSWFSDDFYNFPFNKIEFNTGALNASLGFIYHPTKDLQFSLDGATGFRAPNVDDAAKIFDSEPGTVIVPNPNLQPEYSYNIDFNIIKEFNDAVQLELNTYYTWLRDAMVRHKFRFNAQDSILYDGTLSNVEAVVNAGKAYIYGAGMSLSAALSTRFSFNSHLTYTKGEDITNNEPLRHIAPLFGSIGLSYQSEKVYVGAYTEFNAQKDIADFSPSERNKTHLYTPEGSPAWATINLKASYKLMPEIKIDAGVENILDKHYRPYSSGISAAGRNFTVALKARL